MQQLRAEVRRLTAERDKLAAKLPFLPRQQRQRIVTLLRAGGLSDREIARRCNVSPTTVGNVRRSLKD